MLKHMQWLNKPENAKALRNIRQHIRFLHGDNIRITSIKDLKGLANFRNDSNEALRVMLSEFEARAPFLIDDPEKPKSNKNTQALRQKYRGQEVPGQEGQKADRTQPSVRMYRGNVIK
jgi:hypothetical protein